MSDQERRDRGSIEWRADDAAELGTLRGYAAVFNSPTVIGSLFRELILPGAFTAALDRDDVRALWNHDPNYVLGRVKAGTLDLGEDEVGLRYTVRPPDTTWARDLIASVARGDITQSSFAFRVTQDRWEPPASAAELPLRLIEGVELYDVSPVTYPAYEQTSVAARNAAGACVDRVALADVRAARDCKALAAARLGYARRRLALAELSVRQMFVRG
jgi:uncharacterized protein